MGQPRPHLHGLARDDRDLGRSAIARGLAANPRLLIIDEAVSALDVSIQAQVLNLLADIRAQTGVAYLFISHDLAVIRQVADDCLVMRHGSVVEHGPTQDVLQTPRHDYTKLLRASVPGPGWKPHRRTRSPDSLPGKSTPPHGGNDLISGAFPLAGA